jgi:hypothetical protein
MNEFMPDIDPENDRDYILSGETVLRTVNGHAIVTTRTPDPGPPVSVHCSDSYGLYTVNRDRLETRNNQDSKVNRWELGLDNHRFIAVKLNGAKLTVNSVSLSSEPGGFTSLNLRVLIVPGSDILSFVTDSDSKAPDSESKAYSPGSLIGLSNVRYIEL